MQNFSFQNIEILNKFQRYLYGHDDLFINLTSLFEKKKLPNKIIFNGSDGVGKATFIYHLINFILSNKEDHSYNAKAKEIDENNKSYLDLINNINFNFKHLKVDDYKKIISIEETREIISFFNKSSINNKPKIFFLEGAENLNKNSSNSILKILEELPENNYFFISYLENKFLLDTIKSRCFNCRLFIKTNENSFIKEKLMTQFKTNRTNIRNLTPGINLKLNILFDELNIHEKDFSTKILSMQNFYLEEKYNKIIDLMHIYIENYFVSNLSKNNFFKNFRIRNKINNIIYNINSINNEIRSSFYEINLLLGIK
ncbi:DNA polymerase III subunit delta' [Candidatus Pelagibacterales bacterium]|jgi:DNA polymerase-3 subunit delta'